MARTSPLTLLELLRIATSYLQGKGIRNPRLDTEVLLAHILGLKRIDLYLRHDQPLNPQEIDRFREAIRRRGKGEPVAYIVGEKEFWSLPFKVKRDVLIPRPETELLVETTVRLIREGRLPSSPPRVLEVGTGSGAIAISIMVELGGEVEMTATDISPKAIKIARLNAHLHGLSERIRFVVGDLFAPLNSGTERFHIIISNPPYIPSGDLDKLEPEIRLYEPRAALDGGPDGLAVIRHIIEEAPSYLTPKGYLALEIGYGQSQAIRTILGGRSAFEPPLFFRDLVGIERVFVAKLKGDA